MYSVTLYAYKELMFGLFVYLSTTKEDKKSSIFKKRKVDAVYSYRFWVDNGRRESGEMIFTPDYTIDGNLGEKERLDLLLDHLKNDSTAIKNMNTILFKFIFKQKVTDMLS